MTSPARAALLSMRFPYLLYRPRLSFRAFYQCNQMRLLLPYLARRRKEGTGRSHRRCLPGTRSPKIPSSSSTRISTKWTVSLIYGCGIMSSYVVLWRTKMQAQACPEAYLKTAATQPQAASAHPTTASALLLPPLLPLATSSPHSSVTLFYQAHPSTTLPMPTPPPIADAVHHISNAGYRHAHFFQSPLILQSAPRIKLMRSHTVQAGQLQNHGP